MSVSVRLLLRDINDDMVAAWRDPQAFGGDKYKEAVQVSDSMHGRNRSCLPSVHIICESTDKLWGYF